MKIAHLSVGDPFTARWVHSQVARGDEVHLIMLKPPTERIEGAHLYQLPFAPPWGYYLNVPHLIRLLRKIGPDVLHVHYATGNATLGRFSGFRPCLLSVWGSDVLLAPNESNLMRRRVIKNLRHYDYICSTSQVLTDTVQSLCPELRNVHQIPIGVDMAQFTPVPPQGERPWITVGTVKSLQPVYGIDLLLEAFSLAKQELMSLSPEIGNRLRLQIVGDGYLREDLQRLALDLGISAVVDFKGYIPNRSIPEVLQGLDIFVALSRSESFGVAVVEASACGVPVIVSDVGGLPEVVQHGVTGMIVGRENPQAAATAIVALAQDRVLRKRLGDAGRRFIQEKYEWQGCLQLMYGVYDKALACSACA